MARERDALQFLAMVRRMLRAAARRVGDSDEFELAELIELRKDVDQAITDAIAGQRAHGKSWAAIGTATGTTRQSARERWGRR